MRVWRTSLAAGLMLIAAKSAFASCKTVAYDTVLRPNAIAVQRDLPVGSVIAEVASDKATIFQCQDELFVFREEAGVKASSRSTYVGKFDGVGVYSTNIDGIGYAVGATPIGTPTANGCDDKTHWVGGISDSRIFCVMNGSSFAGPIVAKAVVRFYKTAATTGTGSITARQVGIFFTRNDHSSSEAWISIASFEVGAQSCTLGSAAINVKMGDVSTAAFQGPGTSPPSRTQTFKIPLNCAKGTSVNVRLDGTAHDANQGMLKLDEGSTSAKGVAIQLLYDDKPVKLGERFNGGVADADGEYSIPLKARYVQTAGSVTPGIASGSATFTITYQ